MRGQTPLMPDAQLVTAEDELYSIKENNMTRTLIPFVALWMLAGCAGSVSTPVSGSLNSQYATSDMMERGVIYILPGIQGVDYHYKNVRLGLQGSGIKCAIKIHPWGSQIPGIKLAINETDTRSDRDWGEAIAADIAAYLKQYPGRPVYIVGQSGGCAVAVFTAESLAARQAPPITGIVLLDASLGADYDLTVALNQCQKGILNFYNLSDVALLEVGTEIFGNLDGSHGDSAGRTGFENSYPKLYQIQVKQDMVSSFAPPHFADTSAAFASRYISPWIIDKTWPVKGYVAQMAVLSDRSRH